ncbi:MAG: hypothetical protein OXI32_04540 [bacterium]|nr:hypothetical protein [bacterium]
MGELWDQYEGHVTQADYDSYQEDYMPRSGPKDLESYGEIMDQVEEARTKYYVNCWREGNSESVGMWKVYTRDGYGVALRSDVKSLQGSLGFVDIQDDGYELEIDKVRYTDHYDHVAPFNPQFPKILRKGEEYQFENEVRIYIRTDIEPQPGIHVETNLAVLIDEVITGPRVEDWYFDLVSKTMDKYNLHNKLVRRSILDESPRT